MHRIVPDGWAAKLALKPVLSYVPRQANLGIVSANYRPMRNRLTLGRCARLWIIRFPRGGEHA